MVQVIALIKTRIMPHMQMCLSCRPRAQYIPSPTVCRLPKNTDKSTLQRRNKESYLLDIGNLGGESLRNLRNHLLNQRLVFHRLACLHDTNDGSLNHIFTVLVDSLEYLRGLGLHFSFNRLV
jgi:hypothetical protein